MKKGKWLVFGLLGLIISVGLNGCNFIVIAKPNPKTIVEMGPGEKKLFKVEGAANLLTTKCGWQVTRLQGDSPLWSLVLENQNEFEFEANSEGEPTNRILIKCNVMHYGYYFYTGYPGYSPELRLDWHDEVSQVWEVRIHQDTAPVWHGDYYIKDSTDLNLLNGYTDVTGSLFIFESNIKNLTGLENMSSIGGDLSIEYNNALTSLSGLENLTSVGGNLSIDSNAALTSLSGLENITSVGGSLEIGSDFRGNDSLTSLTGLEKITSVGGNLEIDDNDALTSLSGLGNLTSVGGDLDISINKALTSLNGLDNLTSVGGGLWIGSNNALTNLSGLEKLTSLDSLSISCKNLTSTAGLENLTSLGSLSISNASSLEIFKNLVSIAHNNISISGNDNLISLAGMENLTSVGGSLDIYGNPALTSLTGLENVTSVGRNLFIGYNDALTSLEMAGLQRIDGDFSIYYNRLLCRSLAEELRDQVLAGGGIGGERNIEGNKDCTTP